MKYRLLAVILLILFTLPALSCLITSRDTHVEISCQEFADNPTGIRNDFKMETGDKLYVKLCSNGTTGFQWSYAMSGDDAVMEEDYDFEPADSDLPGAAGKETWTFEATEKGLTVINMEYSQPWDGGMKAEWTYTINIEVE